MKKYIFVLFLFCLFGCQIPTPKSDIAEDVVMVQPIAMNPNPKICKFKKTVFVTDFINGDFQKIYSDICHHATAYNANAFRIIRMWGQRKDTTVELYKCPDDYLNSYKQLHLSAK